MAFMPFSYSRSRLLSRLIVAVRARSGIGVNLLYAVKSAARKHSASYLSTPTSFNIRVYNRHRLIHHAISFFDLVRDYRFCVCVGKAVNIEMWIVKSSIEKMMFYEKTHISGKSAKIAALVEKRTKVRVSFAAVLRLVILFRNRNRPSRRRICR